MKLTKNEFLKMVDHTILKPNATTEQVKEVIEYAKNNNCASVCINPCFVSLAKDILAGSNTKVCTVIGFPLGANTTEVKVFEAKDAAKNGADEIDMVINISKMKDKDYDYVLKEIESIKNSTDKLLKVIIEDAYLTKEEIKIATELCVKAKADFVKTSTGFAETGAKVEDVSIMKQTGTDNIKIKAAGGIKSLSDVLDLYEAGATRFGLSRTKDILNEME